MREILFRGNRRDNCDWIVGQLLRYEDGRARIIESQTDIFCYEKDNSIIQTVAHEVYPITVGQFTGLTDKNGKKVFEGDILKFTDINADYEWLGRVEFGNPNEEYNWGFQLVYIKGEKPNTDILLWFDMEDTGAFAEVIGNIHDNPELLED